MKILRATAIVGSASRRERKIRQSTWAFTLVEILIAVGILGMVSAAIFSTWTAILRSAKSGLDAAASVQRSRIAVRVIEDSLVCVQSYAANQAYYGFVAENGSEPLLSFVARLPKSYPRSGKFGDFDVRRVAFTLEKGPNESTKRLVLRQSPLMMEWDEDEKVHPLVLARHVSEFKLELLDPRGKWLDEWPQTNQLPRLVKFTLKIADNEFARRGTEQEIVGFANLASATVQPQWQRMVAPGQNPGVPTPGTPGQPGQPANPVQPFVPGSGPPR